MFEKREWDILNDIHKLLCIQTQALEVLVITLASKENVEKFLSAKKYLLKENNNG